MFGLRLYVNTALMQHEKSEQYSEANTNEVKLQTEILDYKHASNPVSPIHVCRSAGKLNSAWEWQTPSLTVKSTL